MVAPATLFVTGTDTGVGKTLVSVALLRHYAAAGVSATGFKPVASGAVRSPQGLRNDDALALLAASAPDVAYDELNPYCFEPPIAPHLAAREADVRIEPGRLDAAYRNLARRHERIVVEGAGGWLVPLDECLSFGDWAASHPWPVLLVVAMRLGCINHALLSAEAITRRTSLCGWVANVVPPAPERLEQNIETLRDRMPAPLLGTISAGAAPQQTGAVARAIAGVL
ncbi:MAG: dethiobiotin synthase [Nevskia sp.]|nr:dethiobiotin synthase [Nevskia sp.]